MIKNFKLSQLLICNIVLFRVNVPNTVDNERVTGTKHSREDALKSRFDAKFGNKDLADAYGPFDQFWDHLLNLSIPSTVVTNELLDLQMLEKLKENAIFLEIEKDETRNWRDDRKYMVDFVDPHKYPFVRGVTQLKDSIAPKLNFEMQDSQGHFQLMPSNVHVSNAGRVSIKSYINNLHPLKHSRLYKSIEALLTLSLPSFGHVLQSIYNPRRTILDLNGRHLQFIIGIKGIFLPPNSSYAGSTWHTEALRNEHVVASGIYYYDVENIANSELAFKVQMDSDGNNFTEFDSVVAKSNRLVVFPNIYTHMVRPFSLEDNSKGGHRKIITMFLVDPAFKIISTADVDMQQESWKDLVSGNNRSLNIGLENETEIPYLGTDIWKTYFDLISEERGGANNTNQHDTCTKYRHQCHRD